MPYTTGEKKAKAKPKKKQVIKNGKRVGVGMTQNQRDKLKEHSKHHSAKHIASMRKDMKNGMSFRASHNKAMKMVGK